MATRQEKDIRLACLFGGLFAGLCLAITVAALSSRKDASIYLNDEKYVIDTTMIVHHRDTTYRYQFSKK